MAASGAEITIFRSGNGTKRIHMSSSLCVCFCSGAAAAAAFLAIETAGIVFAFEKSQSWRRSNADFAARFRKAYSRQMPT